MQVGMKFDKRFFFDRKAVEDVVGKRMAKALGKAGAFIRRRARSSLRKRRKASEPGKPPSVHTNDNYATLRNIQFQFDPDKMSVVVGPIKLNYTKAFVPFAMEHGATMNRSDAEKKRVAARANELFRMGRDAGGRYLKKGTKQVKASDIKTTITYAPRPFMGPALAAEASKFPLLFSGQG